MAEPARQTVTEPTITLRSKRFGVYEVAEGHVISMPDGLIGFPDARRFALLEPPRPGSPFRWLICLEEPELGFVVCDPEEFWPGYGADVPRPGPDHGVVLVIVTVPPNPREMTANLMAPIVIEYPALVGRQVVLDTGRHSVRHPLLPAPAPAAAR